MSLDSRSSVIARWWKIAKVTLKFLILFLWHTSTSASEMVILMNFKVIFTEKQFATSITHDFGTVNLPHMVNHVIGITFDLNWTHWTYFVLPWPMILHNIFIIAAKITERAWILLESFGPFGIYFSFMVFNHMLLELNGIEKLAWTLGAVMVNMVGLIFQVFP